MTIEFARQFKLCSNMRTFPSSDTRYSDSKKRRRKRVSKNLTFRLKVEVQCNRKNDVSKMTILHSSSLGDLRNTPCPKNQLNDYNSLEVHSSLSSISKSDDLNDDIFLDTTYTRRFLAIFLINVIILCYSASRNMTVTFRYHFMDVFSLSDVQYQSVFLAHYVPNLFISPLAGLVVDKLVGLRLAAACLSFLGLAGQFLISVGTFLETYWLMLIGKMTNGIVIENITLLLYSYVIIWCKGREVCFTYGINLLFSRMGVVVSVAVAWPIHNLLEEHISEEHIVLGISSCTYIVVMIVQVICLLVLGRLGSKSGKSAELPWNRPESRNIMLSKLISFPSTFWLLIIQTALTNSTCFMFVSSSETLLTERYGISSHLAIQDGLFYCLVTALLCPFVGFLVYGVGNIHFFNVAGSMLGAISMIILLTTNNFDLLCIPLIMLSVCFATLNSCGVTLIVYLLRPYQLSTAYGIQTSITAFTIVFTQLLLSSLYQMYGNFVMILFFLIYLVLSFMCSIMACVTDTGKEGFAGLYDNRSNNSYLNK